jgi:hypothetical protein
MQRPHYAIAQKSPYACLGYRELKSLVYNLFAVVYNFRTSDIRISVQMGMTLDDTRIACRDFVEKTANLLGSSLIEAE